MTYKGIGEYRAITLTVNQDILTGTSGNDTFEAPLAGAVGTTSQPNTLTLGDKLDGGLGIDTLNATLNGNATNFTLNSIEKVFFTPVTAATVTHAMRGVEELWIKDGLDDLTVGTVAEALTIGIQNYEGKTLTVDYGTNTIASQTLVLDGAVDATVAVTMAGLKALTIKSQGDASEGVELDASLTSATSLTFNAASDMAFTTATFASVTSVTVSGDAVVDISDLVLGTTGTGADFTLNATAAAAGLDVTLANDGGSKLTANFGAGDDSLDIDCATSFL